MAKTKTTATAKRERGEGGLFKMRGSRNWYAQFYKDGRQIRVSTKTEIKEKAKRELRKMMAKAERGEALDSDIRKLHYADLRKSLLNSYVTKGNKSLQVLKDGEETIWGLHALDAFFEYDEHKPGAPVTRMTTDAAQDFVRQRQKERIGNAAINRSLALLRRMLRLAYQANKIARVPHIEMLKEPEARSGFIEKPEFDKLLAQFPEPLKPLILFLYYCGGRKGEAEQIVWKQVDLNRGLINLAASQTKTKKARFVPLPDELIRILEDVPLIDRQPDSLVFCNTNLRKRWEDACSAAGFSGLQVHDLRRSAIRNLTMAGVPEAVAMQISGHKTRAVFDRYNIVSPEQVLQAMRRVQGLPEPFPPASTQREENGESSVREDRLLSVSS